MSEGGRAHVVGAGLAGLAAAVALAAAGRRVRLYEMGGHAGGRCRSYFDQELGCRIDNGNHLLLSGNEAALSYLRRIGALDTLDGPNEAAYPFIDLASGERWILRPNEGALPWWILCPGRRVPGTRALDYLRPLALRYAKPEATVAAVLDDGRPLYRRLWEPLAVAALNTEAERGSARLFGALLRETLGRGGAACRPRVPREGLSESLVDPALAWLAARGAEIRWHTRLRAIEFAEDRAARLLFEDGPVALGGGDSVILAAPAAVAERLVPGLVVPDCHAPIVNAHFRCTAPPAAPLLIGVVGGLAQWIFRKREVLSVTISAAGEIVERPAEELSRALWSDVARAYRLPEEPPPGRILKERRATFLASPDQLSRRPAARTRWPNLLLAGDYVDTGLPATIEGAIRSGFAAAGHVTAMAGGTLAVRAETPKELGVAVDE